MAKKGKKKKIAQRPGVKVVARNRKARHDFTISDTFEAGMALVGTEVKSLRDAKVDLGDAYAKIRNGEIFLVNCRIAEYTHGNLNNHDPMRERKLLLKRREINRLQIKIAERGFTLVALEIYFVRGKAKTLLGLAKGKKLYDRREDIKRRDIKRQMARGDDY